MGGTPFPGLTTRPSGRGRGRVGVASRRLKATPREIKAWRGAPMGGTPFSGLTTRTSGGGSGVGEVESGRCIKTLEGHTERVWSVAVSPDGRYAFSGSDDKTVRVWEVESGRCIKTLEGHTGSALSVAVSPDGRYALSGSDDKTV